MRAIAQSTRKVLFGCGSCLWDWQQPISPPRNLVQLLGALVPIVIVHWGQANTHAEGPTNAADRPNIVLIMADDLGYGDLSCYRGWIETPNLDRLAKAGVRFTDFHSSGNVCSPTRAGLLTGRYQQRAGIPSVIRAAGASPLHYHGLQREETTFAELLRAAGYETAMFGKWHLGYETQYNPTFQGFQLFRGYVSGNIDFFSHVDQSGVFDWWSQTERVQEAGYTTHLITEHSLRFVRNNTTKNFCLYLAHEAPHYPYQGPNDQPERTVGGRFKTSGARSDIKTAYREMVQEMDKGIGQLIALLDELDLSRKTLLLFFSDNGANRNGSNAPLRGNKGSNWEGGHRVPAIAWWPGQIEPAVSDETTITLDVMPTILSAAGVTPPSDLDGISLLDHLLHQQPLTKRHLVWNGAAIRQADWKLVEAGRRTGDSVQLFNLSRDLGEQENLAAMHPEIVKSLQAKLEHWKKDVGAGIKKQPLEYAEKKAREFRRNKENRK